MRTALFGAAFLAVSAAALAPAMAQNYAPEQQAQMQQPPMDQSGQGQGWTGRWMGDVRGWFRPHGFSPAYQTDLYRTGGDAPYGGTAGNPGGYASPVGP